MCVPMGMVYTFGDLNPEIIFDTICSIVENK